MKNKDSVAIRSHVSGVTRILQKELLQRLRQFKDVLAGVNEPQRRRYSYEIKRIKSMLFDDSFDPSTI
jgi:hypothetical protein